MRDKFSLPAAIALIVLSTFMVTGTTHFVIKKIQAGRVDLEDKKEFLTKIIQTGPQRERLSSFFLEQVLGLSKDKPCSLKEFDKKKGQEALMSLPMVESAHLDVIGKEILYVDYTLKEPIAKMSDFENLGVDASGYVFPLSFFSPKELTEFYFGQELEGVEYFKPIQSEGFDLCLNVFKALDEEAKAYGFFVKRIDVSKAFEMSFGQEEIVIEIEDKKLGWQENRGKGYLYRLRVSKEGYLKELGNYLNLHQELTASYGSENEFDEKNIDLRIEGCAFIDKILDETTGL